MLKLINRAANEEGRSVGVLSARKSARFLELSDNTFSKGMAAGYFIPQAFIEGDARPSFGFEKTYLEEIKVVLPKDLARGQSIFVPAVIAALQKVNERWKKRSSK